MKNQILDEHLVSCVSLTKKIQRKLMLSIASGSFFVILDVLNSCLWGAFVYTWLTEKLENWGMYCIVLFCTLITSFSIFSGVSGILDLKKYYVSYQKIKTRL